MELGLGAAAGPAMDPSIMEGVGGEVPGIPMAGPPEMGMPPQESLAGSIEDESIEVFVELREALMGQHPNPEQAIRRFVEMFGEEAYQQVLAAMEGGAPEVPRLIEGGGDGMSDSVMGMVDGQEPIAVASGEVVVPASDVANMGNGSSEAGARNIFSMLEEIRRTKTGSPNLPPDVDIEEMLAG